MSQSVVLHLLLMLTWIFVLGSCKNPELVALPELTGAEMYRKTCARCHGGQGEGGYLIMGRRPPAFADCEVQARLSDDAITRAILYGRPGMPPFRGVYSVENVRKLVSYLRSLESGITINE